MNLEQSNVCRLCASSCKKFILIFDKACTLNFAEKIKSYLHVDIENTSNGKKEVKMCNNCTDKITAWDKFALQVKKVDEMFKAVAKNNTKNIKKGTEDFLDQKSVIQQSVLNDDSKFKKLEHRKGKNEAEKVDSKTQKENEFSDEDDVPLATHIESTKGDALNNVNIKETKCKKNIKPKVKLKIDVMKKSDDKESCKENEEGIKKNLTNDIIKSENDKKEKANNGDDYVEENKNNDNGDGQGDGNSDDDDDEDDDDEEEDFKDENVNKTNGLQSLFMWECINCNAPVKNWNALVKHCKESHNCNASVRCVCGKLLQSRASIMKHRTKHTIGYGFKCEYENCNKTFHRQQLLDVHSLSHMPKELQPWLCCKCSRRFHTESLLKQHEKVHLPKEEKLIHPCDVCKKKFCSKSAVSAHVRAVHFGERPFVCDQCGHSFTSKGILHEHLTIHSDVYNFHCKDCNKSFKTKYRLKIHMDTHVETRYQCPICTLTLNTRRTLRMHLLVHKDDKAFQCTTCGKAFKRSKDLKNHYNLHTGRRPYTCPFCQRTFANGSNCRSHKRRMHPEELKMYEAALAAGQEPIICKIDDGRIVEENLGNGRRVRNVLDDSNESKSEILESSKFSEENSNPISLVSYGIKNLNSSSMGKREKSKNNNNNISIGETSTNFHKSDSSGSSSGGGRTRIIRERKEKEETNKKKLTETNGSDNNVVTDFTQIGFSSNSSQNLSHYPISNLYAYSSGEIPGNSFFK